MLCKGDWISPLAFDFLAKAIQKSKKLYILTNDREENSMADLVSIKEAMKSGRIPILKAQVQEALGAGICATDVLTRHY